MCYIRISEWAMLKHILLHLIRYNWHFWLVKFLSHLRDDASGRLSGYWYEVYSVILMTIILCNRRESTHAIQVLLRVSYSHHSRNNWPSWEFFCISGTKQALRTISKCSSDLSSGRSLWAELSILLWGTGWCICSSGVLFCVKIINLWYLTSNIFMT